MLSKEMKFESLRDFLAFLHKNYGNHPANLLTPEALQLKFSINTIMNEVKEFLPEVHKDVCGE